MFSLLSKNNVQWFVRRRRFHLISGILGTLMGLLIINIFINSIAIAILGTILVWFSWPNIFVGALASEQYLYWLSLSKKELSPEEEKLFDKEQERLNNIRFWTFYILPGGLILFSTIW